MSQPPDDGSPPAYEPFAPPSPPQEQPPPAVAYDPYGQHPGLPPQYPGYGYGYAPPPSSEGPAGTDGFAIASLVLGILSVIPLALIFGFVALRRIAHGRKGGRGLAIAGIVISIAWVVVIVAAFAVASLGKVSRSDNGQITSAGRVAATDLQIGDCIQFPKDTTNVETFDAVPCSTPHDAEAYAAGIVPVNGDWPGETAMQHATDSQCSDAFEAFVGVGIDDSVLEVSYFYPQQLAWEHGERGYVCVVGSDVSKTTGTLRGAAR